MSEDIKKAVANLLANSPDGLTFNQIASAFDFPAFQICLAIDDLIDQGDISDECYQITQNGRAKYGH